MICCIHEVNYEKRIIRLMHYKDGSSRHLFCSSQCCQNFPMFLRRFLSGPSKALYNTTTITDDSSQLSEFGFAGQFKSIIRKSELPSKADNAHILKFHKDLVPTQRKIDFGLSVVASLAQLVCSLSLQTTTTMMYMTINDNQEVFRP